MRDTLRETSFSLYVAFHEPEDVGRRVFYILCCVGGAEPVLVMAGPSSPCNRPGSAVVPPMLRRPGVVGGDQGAALARVLGAHLVTEVVDHPVPEPQHVYPRCGPEQLKLPESSYPDAKLLRRGKYLCGI